METTHQVFIQRFYEDSPLEGIVGTIENPAYYLGNIHSSDGEIIGIDIRIPDEILITLFDNQLVNVFIPAIGLRRKVHFSNSKTLRLFSGLSLPADVE